MKVLFFLMILGVSWESSADYTCQCGWRNMKRIVNGRPTGKNEYPWMVYLSNGCGGSIITEYHVLTAAHCTEGSFPSYVVVSVGMHYIHGENEHMKRYSVAGIIEHRGYQEEESINDISILVLALPMTFNRFIGPVCMPTSRFDLLGKSIKVTGWGLTRGTGDENVLREVNLKVISNRECKQKWPELNDVPTQICAYSPGKDSCNGDSGGALVYEDPESKRYTQVALVSYGPAECGSDPRPSVNTDVYVYMDWIKHAVAESRPGAEICMKISKNSEENIKSMGDKGDLWSISKDLQEKFSILGTLADLLGISQDSQEKYENSAEPIENIIDMIISSYN